MPLVTPISDTRAAPYDYYTLKSDTRAAPYAYYTLKSDTGGSTHAYRSSMRRVRCRCSTAL